MSSFYAAISFLQPFVNGNVLRFISQRAPCAGLYYDGSRCHAAWQAEDEIIRRPNGLEQNMLDVCWPRSMSDLWFDRFSPQCCVATVNVSAHLQYNNSGTHRPNLELKCPFPISYHAWFHTLIDFWPPDPKNYKFKAQPRSSLWWNHRQHHW